MGNPISDTEDFHNGGTSLPSNIPGRIVQLPTSITGYLRPSVGVTTSTCIVGVGVPGWPPGWTLGVEVLSLIPFPLDLVLFVEVVASFPHCPFHVYRSVI